MTDRIKLVSNLGRPVVISVELADVITRFLAVCTADDVPSLFWRYDDCGNLTSGNFGAHRSDQGGAFSEWILFGDRPLYLDLPSEILDLLSEKGLGWDEGVILQD